MDYTSSENFEYFKKHVMSLLTRIYMEDAVMHPDGKPWQKCCKSGEGDFAPCGCAVTRGAINIESFEKKDKREIPFVCCHRKTEDGFYRVCAGWHKLRKQWEDKHESSEI
jgi:hypothetical protein